jgi:hypothetical protein
MRIIDVYTTKNQEYELCPEAINVIRDTTGLLKLPKLDNLGQLKVIFVNPGSFVFEGYRNLKLGNYVAPRFITHPGQPGFDTQPAFLHIPEKECWYCMTVANIIVVEEKDVNKPWRDLVDVFDNVDAKPIPKSKKSIFGW